MRPRCWPLLALFLLVAALLGCDTTAPQPESQVVVETYLQAEAPLPTIRLTRTVGTDEVYAPSAAAVRGADVAVDRLAGDDSTAQTTVAYSETDSVPGVYAPRRPPVVEPGATYRLRVEPPGGARLTATTTVPDAIRLLELKNDTSTYQSENQPTFVVEPPRRPADRQNVYVFSTTSLLDFERLPDDALRRALAPVYRNGFGPNADSLEDLRTTSSGLLNEANFQRTDDGTLTIELPWLGVAFFGPNEVAINVVDDNYYDFLRSQEAQQQGGFSPGEIPNVIEHVEGGTGIFGSYARVARPVFIRPPDSVRLPDQVPDSLLGSIGPSMPRAPSGNGGTVSRRPPGLDVASAPPAPASTDGFGDPLRADSSSPRVD
ncbi:MAG: DUF4249 family protein [Salinibacter sp.]